MTRSTTHRSVGLAALLAALPTVALCQAPDRVRLTDRKEVVGEIVAVSPGDVEVKDQGTGESRTVPVDRIAVVFFSGEPDALRTARGLLLKQDPAGAMAELDKIEKFELDGASDNVLAEVEFVRAAATARLATTTGKDLAIGEQALRGFLQKRPRSHHVFEASELLGDLLVRAGTFDAATAAYAALEKGPPAFRARAALAKARSFFEQKRYAEADKEYDAAIAAMSATQDKDGVHQTREAEVGKARCLARQGKAPEAVDRLRAVVRESDPTDGELLARAYAVLGEAQRAAANDQDAIIAFLTVDLVYNTVPDCHAEALYNLVQLWQKLQNPERSREAKQSLETSYPDSRWTKALATAAGSG